MGIPPAARERYPMTIREWFAALFRPRAAGSVALSRPDWLIRHPWLKEAGVTVNTETAVQVSAVYGCCRLIVDSLASAPIRVYGVERQGRREVLHDDPNAYTLNWGAPVDKVPDAPSAQAIEESLYWSALLWGNGYAEIQRDGAGKFLALWPLESDRVTPKRDESGEFYYEVSQPTGGITRVSPMRMFHLRGPSLYGFVGDSMVYRAAKAIGIAHASQVFSAAYFANGTVLSGYLKSPKLMGPEKKKRFGVEWKETYGSPGKAHGVPLLDEGLEYVALNHDAQKSQLVEARRFQVQEIARFFGVPTTLLADNEAWTNLSELYLGFYRNALLPWAERFDAEATRKLFPQRQPWREVQHDLTQIIMGTEAFKRTAESLRTLVNGGLKTRNEARTILGDNSIGADGDVLVVEGTVATLDDILEPPEPAAPALPAAPPGGMPMEPREREEDPRARAAIVAMFGRDLERYERKLANRYADLARRDPLRFTENIAEARAGFRADLLRDCAEVVVLLGRSLDVEAAASAVESGEPPRLAAERFIAAGLATAPVNGDASPRETTNAQ